MSEDDQAQSIGRLVIGYVESKRKLATMQAEITRLSEACIRAGTALRDRMNEPAVSNECTGLPQFDNVNSLLSDLHSEQKKHAELLQRIKAIGLEG